MAFRNQNVTHINIKLKSGHTFERTEMRADRNYSIHSQNSTPFIGTIQSNHYGVSTRTYI